jgi:glutamine synthetase
VTQSRALLPDLKGATAKDVLELTAKLNVRFLRLQFTDILGVNKNVELPRVPVGRCRPSHRAADLRRQSR